MPEGRHSKRPYRSWVSRSLFSTKHDSSAVLLATRSSHLMTVWCEIQCLSCGWQGRLHQVHIVMTRCTFFCVPDKTPKMKKGAAEEAEEALLLLMVLKLSMLKGKRGGQKNMQPLVITTKMRGDNDLHSRKLAVLFSTLVFVGGPCSPVDRSAACLHSLADDVVVPWLREASSRYTFENKP